MLKQLKVARFITFYLGIVSAIGVVCSLFVFEYIRPLSLRYEIAEIYNTWWDKTILIAIVVSLLFHVSAMLTTMLESRYIGGNSTFRRIVLIMVVISFMGVCSNAGLLGDIAKESEEGWDVSSEWVTLYLSLIPQVIAHILVIGLMVRLQKFLKSKQDILQPTKDDTMFYAINCTGLVCGAVGLWITLMTYFVRTSLINLKVITMYYNAIILIPYIVLITYWLITKMREHVVDWYDEKQMADSTKAGTLALLVSFPVMAFIYMTQLLTPGTPADVLWFPLYIHIVLLMFSGLTMYYKEN